MPGQAPEDPVFTELFEEMKAKTREGEEATHDQDDEADLEVAWDDDNPQTTGDWESRKKH